MAEKILSIKLTGDTSSFDLTLQKSIAVLNGLGLTADNVKTKLNEATKQFDINLTTTSAKVKLLQKAFADLHALNLHPNNTGNITNNISRDAEARRQQILDARATAFSSGAQASGTNINNRLALEQSARINGANAIKTIELKAAQDEKAIREQLAKDILAIEKQVADGTIATLRAANQQKAQLERQAAKEITDIRKNTEKEQSTIKRRSDSADIYKQETQQVQNALNSRLALERAIRLNGANSIQVIEIQAAQREEAIRRASTQRLLQIEQQLRDGTISNRGAANASRNAILQQTRAQITANRVTLEAAQKTEAHNAQLRATQQAHISLFAKVGEFIGLYRIWNLAINTVTNSLRAIPKIGIELEATQASLTATLGSLDISGKFVGSTVAMGSAMKALDAEAKRTGISITTLRESFRGFQASTSLAGEKLEDTWKMFTNLNTVITGLHLPADKANGIFLAMAQIFNKTKVQSEELVKQLGNLLPGAFASFAAANQDMFKNSADLIAKMKQGVVFAHDTVLKFTEFLATRFGPAFEAASQGLNSNIGRMSTAFTHLGEAIYNQTSGPMNTFVKSLASMADWITEDINGVNKLGAAVQSGLNAVLIATTLYLAKVTAGFITTRIELIALGAASANVSKSMFALQGAMSFLSSPTAILSGLALIGLGIADLRKKTEDTLEQIHALRDLELGKAAIKTPEDKITFDINQDPEVIKATARYNYIEERIAKIKSLQSSLTGFKNPKDTEEVKQLRSELLSAETQLLERVADARTSIELKSASESLALIEAKEQTSYEVHLAYLEKIKTADAAAQAAALKFDRQNDPRKADLERVVVSAKAKDANPDQLEEAKKASKLLEELAITREKTIAEARLQFTTTGIASVTSISKSAIKSIESEAKLALERLKTEQENIDNKVRLRQLSFNDAYKERLRISKEILAIDLSKANQKTVAITGKSNLQEQSTGSTVRFSAAIEKYSDNIVKAAEKWKVPADYIKAVISKESGGILNAVNVNKGGLSKDLGLMQVNTKAHPQYEANKLLTDASYNINAGTKILAESLRAFPGDLVKGFAAYNAGIRGASKGVSTAYGEDVVKWATGSTNKQIAQGVKDSVDIEVQADAIERAYEADKQRTQEAQKLLELNREELKVISDSIEIDYLRATGLQDQADILELNNKYRVNEELLSINGLKTEQNKVVYLKSQEVLQLSLNRISERKAIAEQTYQNKVQETNTLLSAGILSHNDVANLLADSKKKYLVLQDEEIVKLQEILSLNTDNLEAQGKLVELQNKKAQEVAQARAAGANILTQNDPTGLRSGSSTLEQQLATAAEARAAQLEGVKDNQEQMAQVESDYRTQKTSAYLQYYGNIASFAAKSSSEILAGTIRMYGAQSKEARKAFAIYKAAKSAEVIINTASAAIGAFSAMASIPYVGPVLGVAAAAIAVAAGAYQLQQVNSAPMPQAHAGLTSVPDNNQTYLLKQGERVIAPQQNKDLTKALAEGSVGNGSSKGNINNIKIVNNLDPSIVGDFLATSEGETLIMNTVRRNQAA